MKYKNDIPIGFAQCQLRYDYVEGTKTTPVGYLEGIFIKDGYLVELSHTVILSKITHNFNKISLGHSC